VRSSPIPFSSSGGGIGHGHPNHPPGSTGISGVGHGHMIPQGFQPHPELYHSHSYEGPVAQHPYNQYRCIGLSPFWLGDCGIIRGVLIAGCPPVELYECGTKYPCGH
jgi:hypothetical protein